MPTSEAEASGYRLGLACLAAATLFTSTAGLLVRLFEQADGWQILFYRALWFIAAMLVFIVWRRGRRTVHAFLHIGRPGLATAAFLSGAFIFFVFAVLETTVANVVFTISLSPFFAALFAWFALREAVARSTLLAMVGSLAGVGLMVMDGVSTGTLAGNALALAACLCYSAALVAMRGGRSGDMAPAVLLSGIITAGLAAVMVDNFAMTRHDLGLAAIFGIVQLGFQYMLILIGSRYVPAAEIAFIGRANLILAPLLVWIGVGEVPGTLTLLGGLIVLIALTGHGWLALRRSATMQRS